jgi:hypothetical protein
MGEHIIFWSSEFWDAETRQAERDYIRETLEDFGYLERECRCGRGTYRLNEKEIEELVDQRYYELDRIYFDDEKGNFAPYKVKGQLVRLAANFDKNCTNYELLSDDLSDLVGYHGGDMVKIYVDDADMDVHVKTSFMRSGDLIRYVPYGFLDDCNDITEFEDEMYDCETKEEYAAAVAKWTKPLGREIQKIYGWAEPPLPENFESDVYIKHECRKKTA